MIMSVKHILYAVLIAVIWGCNFSISKLGLQELPPFLMASFRFIFTALPLVFILKKPAISLKRLGAIGLTQGVLAFGFCFYSIQHGLPVGLLSLLYQSHILFTVLLSYFVFGTIPTRQQIFGVLVAMIGLFYISNNISLTHTTIPLLGVLGVFVAAFFWAAGSVLTKTVGKIDSLSLIVWSALFSGTANLILSFYIEGADVIVHAVSHITMHSLLVMGYLVLCATIIATSLQAYLIQKYSPTQVSPFMLLVPITGLLGGWLIFDEQISLGMFIGCCVVFAGLIINQWPSKEKNTKFSDIYSEKKVA